MPTRRAALRLAAVVLALAARPGEASRGPETLYDLSVGGLPVGEAALRVDMGAARYAVEARADFGFLMFGGEGTARSEGAAADGALRPERYRLAYQGVTRPGLVEIDFEGGRAVRTARLPDPREFDDPGEARAPLEAVHLADVLDPLAALVVAAGPDAPPDAVCRGVLPVYSGYVRFDLVLEGGAPDPAGGVACAIRYVPVAGHRLESASVARLSRPGALALTLAPVADGAWAPARLALPTRFGTFELVRRPDA